MSERSRSHRKGKGADDGSREAPMVPRASFESYYGRPILKAPVWEDDIAYYFFLGGLSAGCALLSAGADITGRPALRRGTRVGGLAALGLGSVFLIKDLGRPERFLNMLRVFKPTSPMSVGTWLVSLFGAATAAATPWQLTGLTGFGPAAAVTAAFAGPAVSTYTAVLIAQTSVPVWHDARRELPFLFAGSSLASAGGATAALTPPAHAAPARALAIGGAALELAADAAMSRRLDPRVRNAYEHPSVRPAHLGARACTVLGAALVAARRPRAGGLALCAGSALQRIAVIRAGRASAGDPAATVGPQRERGRHTP
ncbi:MAG: hypothetical protein QOF29_21 [bacterium]